MSRSLYRDGDGCPDPPPDPEAEGEDCGVGVLGPVGRVDGIGGIGTDVLVGGGGSGGGGSVLVGGELTGSGSGGVGVGECVRVRVCA